MKARSLVIAAAVGTLAVSYAAPASADTIGTTTANITITGGVLAISVQASAGSLGSRANTVAAGTISGALGQVQVTDARTAAAGSGWVTTAISSAFTPSAGPAIAASFVGYTAGAIGKVGTATYVANDPPDLTAVSAAVTASGITGDNAATWNPTINVTVPGGTIAGTYLATITHSVS